MRARLADNRPMTNTANLHNAYAAVYDRQLADYEAYMAEALFGLCFAFVRPSERLLDLGIGSGLPAVLFQQAGLRVDGLDFSAAMLDLCRAKGIGQSLTCHDLQAIPWPFASETYDHATCCGVLHFIGELAPIFHEANRVLRAGGLLACTTRAPAAPLAPGADYERTRSGDFDIFSHAPAAVSAALEQAGFHRLRDMRCFVGEDIFHLWVARKGIG